jgi:hypothetical protein
VSGVRLAGTQQLSVRALCYGYRWKLMTKSVGNLTALWLPTKQSCKE